ncbi:hypothetical protein JCM10212_004849 [Sporobolomyces blumeae]
MVTFASLVVAVGLASTFSSPPSFVSAAPLAPRSDASTASKAPPIRVPIRRGNGLVSAGDRFEFFKKQGRRLEGKYGRPSDVVKRAEAGVVQMTDYLDSIWFGDISIGTPSTTYGVILDTGSSDLIVATPDCIGCPPDTPGYTLSQSSSSTNLSSSEPFSITYGSGAATGYLVEDVVGIADFVAERQTFAVCPEMDNVVNSSISGILGMGWQSIASSGAVPLVQQIAAAGDLPQQVFTFAFESHTFFVGETATKPGGEMMIGGIDPTKYSGEIAWNELTDEGYWEIPLGGTTVNGVDIGSLGQTDHAIIDTGTTLIGMPSKSVEAIYSNIPNSEAVSLDGMGGYYAYPCSQKVSVTLTFGDMAYTLPSSAFNGGTFDQNSDLCLGAIYALSSERFIIGDAFLTTVYSAFRLSSPAAVGFALLGSNGLMPSNTSLTGQVPSNQNTSNGRRSVSLPLSSSSRVAVVAVLVISAIFNFA